MNTRKTLAFLLAMSISLSLLTGCSFKPTAHADTAPFSEADSSESKESDVTAQRLDSRALFSDRDREGSYEKSGAVSIHLDQQAIQCDAREVSVRGRTATILTEGVYLVTGSLEDGQIIVDVSSKEKVQIVLKNVELTSKNTAPIYIKKADKVFLTLADGTRNFLSATEAFEAAGNTNVDGAVFSKADLTINGNGSLTVKSSQGHGIVSKDELTITGGKLTVNAAGHALSGNNCVSISDGVFTLNSGKDGIHSENKKKENQGFICITGGEFHVTSNGDGIDASSIVQVEGGCFELLTGGGSANAEPKSGREFIGNRPERGGMAPQPMQISDNSSPEPLDGEDHPDFQTFPVGERSERPSEELAPPDGNGPDAPQEMPSDTEEETDSSPSTKGIKSDTGIFLDGGTFVIDSADDSIHSNGVVELSAGEYTLSTGDDGIHGDNSVTMTGGMVNILTCYEGVEGSSITIQDGSLSLASSDDGLNVSSGSGIMSINGGTIHVNASGDGFDSNGDFVMTGGILTISGPTNAGNGGIDYSRTGVITGGTLIALSVSTNEQVFSEESTQGSILVSVEPTEGAVSLTDDTGNILAEMTPEKEYGVVLVSCPQLAVGSTYTLKTGDVSTVITMDTLHCGAADAEKGFRGGRGDFMPKDGENREGGRFNRKDEPQNHPESENRPDETIK